MLNWVPHFLSVLPPYKRQGTQT